MSPWMTSLLVPATGSHVLPAVVPLYSKDCTRTRNHSMALRSVSALSRTVSTLRSFLRETWISRIALVDWLQGWAKQ